MKVYNLSSNPLDQDETALLSLGPKFVPTTTSTDEQTKIDILNFSRSILLKAQFYNSTTSDDSLIYPVSSYLPYSTNYKVLKSVVTDLEELASDKERLKRTEVTDNLSVEERRGLQKLQDSKTAIFIEADKGGAPVWLDRQHYKDLMEAKLNTPVYQQLDDNVDYFINVRLSVLTKKYHHMLTKKERLAITNFDYKSTNIYGVPKIHKSKILKEAVKTCQSSVLHSPQPADLTLRIIFGGPKNPTTGLASLVDALLKPFLPKIQARVQDVFEFIRKIPVFSPDDLPFIELWSVDVKDMYPSIEHTLGQEAIKYWIEKYPELLPSRFSKEFVIEALIFVLQNNTGYFDGKFYKQTIGTATGIKPAGTYADLVMGYLEIGLFSQLKNLKGKKVAHYFWQYYRRYLDDGQIMWDNRLGDFQDIFTLMNNSHPKLKFTCEHSQDSLVYLDVTILKTANGIKTEIYQKDTDIDTILPYDSSHPRHTVKSIPFNLARRIKTLTDDPETAESKLLDLQARFLRCGYPPGVVRTAVNNARHLNTKELRAHKSNKDKDQVLTFVHTYDETLPQLVPLVKETISRIYTSKGVRQIFGGTRFIDSQREPQSLGRLLHRPRFEDLNLGKAEPGARKCNLRGCRTCEDILEVNSLYFRNADITFHIKKPMSCITRNLVYATICKKCGYSYIGETTNLRSRMNTHRSTSGSSTTANQENSRHLYKCGMGFNICPLFKVGEENKIARLVKEDNLIKLLKPDLNRDEKNILQLR